MYQQKKNFNLPDITQKPSKKITVDVIQLGANKFQRVTAQPGWRWTIDLKPFFKTDSCQVDHLLYVLSGQMIVRMDNGEELQYEPGDIASIPSGHDGWGIGDEPTVWLEIPH